MTEEEGHAAREHHTANLRREAAVFSGKNNDLVRSIAWSAIPYFSKQLLRKLDILAESRKALGRREERRMLTMACGDMTGEYRFLGKCGATFIDAYDISEGQRARFFEKVHDGEIEVDYRIADVNAIDLPPLTYDIVYMQQSLHHLIEIEHVLDQIAKTLKTDGIFVLNDYVGEPFLQRGPRQRQVCGAIWAQLPPRLRTDIHGRVNDSLFIPAKSGLSPFEAIRSDLILPTLRDRFVAHAEVLFGGVVFPVVNGFASNYVAETEPDETIVRMLWALDEELVATGCVEPTFVRGVYIPKNRQSTA